MLGNAQPKPLDFRLFVAPKDLDVLQTARPPLDGLVDFGWFTIVARPLFLALRYAYHRKVERNRTALARLAASYANFLILDEPTNHLDLWARGALEKALRDFDGSVLFVSFQLLPSGSRHPTASTRAPVGAGSGPFLPTI